MSPKDLTDFVRLKTKSNSTTFPDPELLLLANIFIDDFAKEITKTNEDYFGMEAFTDLKENQREYSFPLDVLNNIKYVEAKLAGTDWLYLHEFDLNSYKRTTDESTITTLFSNNKGKAFYDIFRGSLWIYSGSIIDVAQGLKLWYISYPEPISDLSSETDMSEDPSTTKHGFPRQFHELLARRISIEWKTSGDKPVQLTDNEQKFEFDLRKALDAISPINLDRSVKATIPAASERGDDGYLY